ncbi:MAG: hypothetical protein H6Q90_4896 [Deltaproteobacteria bacterium]|nr:hypothetical protein [Deltaproteobacteria bacterium]
MSYRDDRDALLARLNALELEVKRVDQLEQRVRELEAANRELVVRNRALDFQRDAAGIPLDVDAYVARIVDATRSPAFADRILSGALPIDELRIAEAARTRAAGAGRGSVTREDVQLAARAVLADRVLLRDGVAWRGALDDLLRELVERVPM